LKLLRKAPRFTADQLLLVLLVGLVMVGLALWRFITLY
jgi:hypothetical protein